ncbi:hypothetical protein niasHT_026616 [Heterodera trifolii]|uniref:Uncharacterized protein n=1 Tax=Heterodera trifolii TaxID=157864 RepID=A0ABD2KSC4_9BILA
MLLIAFLITCCLLSFPPIFVVCFAPSRFVVQPSNGKTGGRSWRCFKASSPLMPRGKQQQLSISKQQATKTSSTTSPLLLMKSNRQQRIPLIRPQGSANNKKLSPPSPQPPQRVPQPPQAVGCCFCCCFMCLFIYVFHSSNLGAADGLISFGSGEKTKRKSSEKHCPTFCVLSDMKQLLRVVLKDMKIFKKKHLTDIWQNNLENIEYIDFQTDNDQMEELRKKEEHLWDEMSDVKDEKQREKVNKELQEVQGKLNTIYGQMKDKRTE